jgi:SAM-dependent methyltransferase
MRETCGGCGGRQLDTFLDLGKTPLANTFPETATEAETFYPLSLGRCLNCGLVQQMWVVADAEIYGDRYGFYSGASAAQLAYHSRSAELLLARHNVQARRSVVEIACNDGSLLAHFAKAGCPVLGIDPSAPAQVAIDAGLAVFRRPFTAALAREIRDTQGPAGLVIAYNALAHVADLADILTGIWALLAPDGVAVIEVQYLPDLISGNMYDQIYHEHRYHYSLSSFRHAAELHGLFVVDAELIELQGGGLRVTLGVDAAQPVSRRAMRILDTERWIVDASAYAGMQGRIDRARDHLLDLIDLELEGGRQVIGYAAAAKATTILNYCGIDRTMIPFVVDSTAFKQGKFIPGVKVPIVAPDYAWASATTGVTPFTALLLAPNYLGHLLRVNQGFLDAGGRWLVPIPTPMVI